MCLVTVADCENCSRSSCRELDIFPEAQGYGRVHITRSAYDNALATSTRRLQIDGFSPADNTYLIKIYAAMEQNNIQSKYCNQWQCHRSNRISKRSQPLHMPKIPELYRWLYNTVADIGPLKICEASCMGVIYIGDDAYNEAYDGRVEVPINPSGRDGYSAFVFQLMEEEIIMSEICWGYCYC